MRKPTGYAPSTLQEACGGRRLPTLRVTVAFVSACGGDVEAWKDYWQTIRRASDPRSPAGPTDRIGPPWAQQEQEKEQDEPAAEPNPVPTRRRRPLVAAATVAVIVIAAVLVIVLRHGGSTATAVPRVAASRTSAPAAAGAGGPAPAASPSPPPPGAPGRKEFQMHHGDGGAPTFQDPHGLAGPGPRVPFHRWVTITCKVYAHPFRACCRTGTGTAWQTHPGTIITTRPRTRSSTAIPWRGRTTGTPTSGCRTADTARGRKRSSGTTAAAGRVGRCPGRHR